MRKRYEVISLETGESWQSSWNLSDSKYDLPIMDKYFLAFRMEQLCFDKTLQGNDIRIFVYLCKHMKPGGWIELTHEQIAEDFGVKSAGISMCMTRLIKGEYIEWRKHRITGRRKLRVSEYVAGKGTHAYRESIQTDINEEYKREEPK